MARSDYDTLAFGPSGEPSDGLFTNDTGNMIEICKTLVQVYSPVHDVNGGESSSQVREIAQIIEGSIYVAGFSIEASRGPQGSVFLLASWGWGENKKHVGGIGAQGYEDLVQKVLDSIGRGDEREGDWTTVSGRRYDEETDDFISYRNIHNYDTGEEIFHELKAEWTGILPETKEEYVRWVESLCDEYNESLKKWVDTVKEAPALRFNQGDAFFSRKLGAPVPASLPGEAEAPVIEKMIKPETKEKTKMIK